MDLIFTAVFGVATLAVIGGTIRNRLDMKKRDRKADIKDFRENVNKKDNLDAA